MEFAGYEACVAAGLDLWKWESGVYPLGFMAKVIAWHKLHGLVDMHKEAASIEAAKRKNAR